MWLESSGADLGPFRLAPSSSNAISRCDTMKVNEATLATSCQGKESFFSSQLSCQLSTSPPSATIHESEPYTIAPRVIFSIVFSTLLRELLSQALYLSTIYFISSYSH